MKKRILAVDQSYTCSGIVVLEDSKLMWAEVFKTDKSADTFKRAWEVASHIRHLADIWKPNYIALEGLAFSKVGNATRDLAGLQFTIVNTLQFLDKRDVTIVSPNSVKKEATGSGKAKKWDMVEELPIEVRGHFDNLGVKKTTGLCDLSDAYWIGITAEKMAWV